MYKIFVILRVSQETIDQIHHRERLEREKLKDDVRGLRDLLTRKVRRVLREKRELEELVHLQELLNK